MEFRQQAVDPTLSSTYRGLSAIPIDGHTFQLVNLTPVHSSNDCRNDSLPTPQNPPRSHLFSDTFLAMLSASMDSKSDEPTTPDLSSLTDPFQSPPATNHSSSSLNSSLEGSFIAESRPLPDSFSFNETFSTRSVRNASSILSSIPRGSAISNHPYFTALCDVLRTDLELKKMVITKPNISAMEKDLYDQLQVLEAIDPYQVSTIRTMYQYQSASIEQERAVALCRHRSDIYYSDLLNNHYDDQRVQIINRVHRSVALLRHSLMILPIPNITNHVMSFEASTTPCTSTPFKTGPSMSISKTQVATTPVQSPVASQCMPSPGLFNLIQAAQSPNSNISPATSNPTPSQATIPVALPITKSSISRSRPVLSKPTIHKLEAWYTAHEEHPYPNNEVTEDLANACGITHGQVRKWFANKRNRSKNTKTLVAIACRKRQEKYGFLL